ncbi:hypothetical protein H4R35_001984 [Dimargaris xerosporica]|nr:hypothetical protein H4R35_001984 [Dimargaris xerosporica]
MCYSSRSGWPYQSSVYSMAAPKTSPVVSPTKLEPQTTATATPKTLNITVTASGLASPTTDPLRSPSLTMSPGEQSDVDSKAYWVTMDAPKQEATKSAAIQQ